MRRFFRTLFKVLLFWAVALPLVLLVRARFLPEVEVPILHYRQITAEDIGDHATTADEFERHLLYLCNLGKCETIAPQRLRQYQLWGRSLPHYPLIIVIDIPSQDLPDLIEPTLELLNYTAIVALPTTFIGATPAERRSLNGVPLLTWEEIREIEARGRITFATATREYPRLSTHVNPFNEIRAGRTDYRRALDTRNPVFVYPHEASTPEVRAAARQAKIRYGFDRVNAVAKVGPHTDLTALPTIHVRGGKHIFSVSILQNSLDPTYFGELQIVHKAGTPMPASIRAYRPGDYDPFVMQDVPLLETGVEYTSKIPEDLTLPLEVCVFDEFRIIPYFVVSLGRGDIVRESTYRKPLFKDDGSFDFVLPDETDDPDAGPDAVEVQIGLPAGPAPEI